MAIALNPLLLTPDKKIIITEDYESNSFNPTYLDIVLPASFDRSAITLNNYNKQDIHFDLQLNMKVIADFYKRISAKNLVTFEEFKFAFLTKELLAIRYGTVEFMNLVDVSLPYDNNRVWEYIFCLLEIRRARYRLSYELPAFTSYLSIYNTCVRTTIGLSVTRHNTDSFAYILEEFEVVRAMLESLYKLVIYNDTRIANPIKDFAYPLVKSAERLDIINSSNAAKAIYDYVILPKKIQKSFSITFKNELAYEEIMSDQSLHEERPIILEDEFTGFYRDTLLKRMTEINLIRNVFKRIFTMTETVKSFEGDVDIQKQQQLYTDSLTGEYGKTYIKKRFANNTMDVVIIRDVSFSINLIRVEYAETIITMLAALEGIPNVRTAQIDFSDKAIINKQFENKLKDCLIIPEAFGSTFLLPPLEKVDDLAFKSDKRLVFIITDGEIEDFEESVQLMIHLEQEKKLRFIMIHIISSFYGKFAQIQKNRAVCSYDLLDKVIYTILLKELRRNEMSTWSYG